MKSLTAVCQTGASMPTINPNGRISRHSHQRGDGENAEMKMYLSKLKDLVPFMPKNRKLSKLEIIQHVIDYICDLQSELETHPEIGTFDSASALNFTANVPQTAAGDEPMLPERLPASDVAAAVIHNPSQQQSSPAMRQPLVDRQTPNTILPPTAANTAATAAPAVQFQQQQQPQQMVAASNSVQAQTAEKDSRQSSC